MIETNENLRIKINVDYPPCNTIIFEEFFYNEYIKNSTYTNRIYIPIFWTGLYVNRNYGNGDLSDIQLFLDNLDRSKKYFTIVQYDDNILNDLKDLDILIFTMGGYGKYEDKCYPIPLNCITLPQFYGAKNKDIFASFIGGKTHNIREAMINSLSSNNKYYVTNNGLTYPQFREVMSRSLFSLCPRGYGQTSFRICEALQSESIPVYIYDTPLLPFKDEFDFNEIGILIHESELNKIDEILSSKTQEDINKYLINGKQIYNKYFDYNGCYNEIIKKLNDE